MSDSPPTDHIVDLGFALDGDASHTRRRQDVPHNAETSGNSMLTLGEASDPFDPFSDQVLSRIRSRTEVERRESADVAQAMLKEHVEADSPLHVFQMDITEAVNHVFEALQRTSDRKSSVGSMSDIYLIVGEVVNHLQVRLPKLHDPRLVQREILQAKLTVFNSWLQIIREQASEIYPDSADAMRELEKAYARLFREHASDLGERIQDRSNEIRAYSAAEDLQVTYRGDMKEEILVDDDGEDSDVTLQGVLNAELRVQPEESGRAKAVAFLKAMVPKFPPKDWVPAYPEMGADPETRYPKGGRIRGIWSTLRGDLQGGITAGVMTVPQGMAYAMLGGLPPIMGLYTALVGYFCYALFGTSRQLNYGPMAMVSLMIGAACEESFDATTPEQKMPIAIALAFAVGIIYLLLGLLKAGFVVNFLSQPVLSGFTSAAAVLIAISQLPALTGIHVPFSSYAWVILVRFFGSLEGFKWLTFVLGVSCIVFILILKKIMPSIPGALLVMVGTIAIAWPTRIDQYGVDVVGNVPAGLPAFVSPFFQFGFEDWEKIFVAALPIAIIGFVEHISVAKTWSAKNEYEIDANQELFALGVANIVASFTQAYPAMGGIGRSAVAAAGGVRTPGHNALSGLIVMLALLVLTPLVYYLPSAALAAVLMSAVGSLLDVEIVKTLWITSRIDLFTLAVCFFTTLIGGVSVGIFAAIVSSLLLTLYRASKPYTCELGRAPGTVIYRDVSKYKRVNPVNNMVVVRFDGPVFFGNTNVLKEEIKAAEKRLLDKGQTCRAIIVDATAITTIDYSGVQIVKEIALSYAKKDILFCICHLDNQALRTFHAAGLVDLIGPDHYFFRVHDAVLAVQAGHIEVVKPPPPPPEKSFIEKVRAFRCTPANVIQELPCYSSCCVQKSQDAQGLLSGK